MNVDAANLAGKTILVVEEQPLIALDLQIALKQANAKELRFPLRANRLRASLRLYHDIPLDRLVRDTPAGRMASRPPRWRKTAFHRRKLLKAYADATCKNNCVA